MKSLEMEVSQLVGKCKGAISSKCGLYNVQFLCAGDDSFVLNT